MDEFTEQDLYNLETALEVYIDQTEDFEERESFRETLRKLHSLYFEEE